MPTLADGLPATANELIDMLLQAYPPATVEHPEKLHSEEYRLELAKQAGQHDLVVRLNLIRTRQQKKG